MMRSLPKKILSPVLSSVLVIALTAGLVMIPGGTKALADTSFEVPVCDHDENTSEWTEISADTLPGMEEAESSGGVYG